MTYARARLLLGICGVGSLVTLCSIVLVASIPQRLLSSSTVFGVNDLSQLGLVALLLLLWLIPLDFLGGFILPKQYLRTFESFRFWFWNYCFASLCQAMLFILFALAILSAGRRFGLVGALGVVCLITLLCFIVRNRMVNAKATTSEWMSQKLTAAKIQIHRWQVFVPRVIVVRHLDAGFTGGIIGLGSNATVVVPEAWLMSMSTEELATAIARRAVAVNSGSYERGLALAFIWNFVGFAVCSLLPGAGVSTVAALVTTICGFTLWSFLGLLILPTVSRNASLQIDRVLHQHGTPVGLIQDAAWAVDRSLDAERQRPRMIEAIFHPVPSVSSRNADSAHGRIAAWNVARTALFFSWACFGMLSRAVHCNVGRPELWTMLPID